MLSNEQYDEITEYFADIRRENMKENRRRLAEVRENLEGFSELEEQLRKITAEHAEIFLNDDEGFKERFARKLRTISGEKKQLLLAGGYPEDYLDPVYHCGKCKDTGYVDGEKCSCFRSQEIKLLYSQSRIEEILRTENFSNLTYEYHTGEALEKLKGAVETCRAFVSNFNSDFVNLLFYGTVGSGKSFLSSCIAKELIDRGRSVLYFGAVDFFEMISDFSFNYHGARENLHNIHDELYDCDLLILDDLGTEITNSFVSTQLFSILNRRYLTRKSTIFSTNLDLSELRDRYSDRIFSRIVSSYKLIKLTGPDVRIEKRKLYN